LKSTDLKRLDAATGVPGLNRNDVYSLNAHKPSSLEQARIAAVLDTVDKAITKTEAVIAKLRQVRAGLLHDLLTRGLDAHGQLRDPIARPEQFQDSNLGRIPREWEVHRLSSKADVLGGKRLPSGHVYSELPTGFRYLRVLDFYERAIEFEGLANLRQDTFAALQRYEIRDSELFISIAGSLGYVGVLRPLTGDSFILTENAARIHIHAGYVPEFLSLLMNSQGVQRQISAEKGIGAGVPKLALHRIENLWLARPDQQEQRHIVQFVRDFEDCIASEENEFGKMQRLKSGLMTDLLTGRVRVPERPQARP
jgi:type I restriction enzyme S subunit